MTNRLAVVIPAYRPSAGLVDLVQQLSSRLPTIVIVDDGSGPDFRDVFARAAAVPNVQLLRHAVNLGKGAALKTAFNHVLCSMPDVVGVVTADADGQHHPDDIEGVAETLLDRPGALVLGARAFDGDVPLRSKLGNVATRRVMQALLGQKITDTQTGLRGIPATLLPRLLRLESTGYEFELEMLLTAHHLSIPLIERPIRTIYERGNPTSHFNPLIDSMKIYFVLLRFGSVSAATALLDNVVFILLVNRLGSLLGAQSIARVFSLAFNYAMVRSSVFYSKQQHRAVLPKYIALTIVSGTCSYLGIRMLSTRYGVGVVAAKLLVETFLFFVNFSVQRALIFKPNGGAPAGPRRPVRLNPIAAVLGAVFVALVAIEAYGIRTSDLFSQDLWHPEGLRRFERFAEVYAGLAVLLIFLAPRWFPAILTALLAVLTVMSVGPAPLAAVAFLFLSANALGAMLLRMKKQHAAEDHVCATLLGVGVYTFVMTFACRVPVNYPVVWGIALAAPVLLDLRGFRHRAGEWFAWLKPAQCPPLANRAALALLLFILIAHWFVVLKPESSADGLAMHLSIPVNIATEHRITLEPSRFLWAVMPMAADFSYTIAYLLGGEYASRLVLFAMLLAICALLYRALRRWIGPSAACLLTAAFASTPIVQFVTGALFVENFLAAMILGVMTAIWRLGDTGERRFFYLAMALGGTAMSVKFGALAFVLIALPFAFLEARRHWRSLGPRPAATCVAGVVLLLAMAAPPFAVAYVKTGNPLFPFLGTKFPSPFLPKGFDIRDARFKRPLTIRILYDMAFHSDQYYEGQRGSLGFQYLALAPLGLLGFAAVRRRPAVSAAVVAAGASLVIMSTEPNARYLYSAMPLVLIPAGAMLGWARENGRALYSGALLYVIACVGLNAYFLPSSSYYHKDFSLKQPFSRAEHDRYVLEAAPVRKVIEYFNRAHPGQTVLFTHEGSNAGTNGVIYENHWHQIATLLKIREAAGVPAMLGLMKDWKIEYFIGRKPIAGDVAQPPALAEFLANCTLPEFEAADYYLARLEPGCRARSLTEPAIVVPPGYYGDDDPALVYQGEWKQEANRIGPDRMSHTSVETTGAQVSLAFDGKALYYIFSRGPNGGIADVTIDGQHRDPIDMYYPATDWQRKEGYCCFAPGRHVIVVRATDRKNPASSGHVIDVDSFSVVQ
jgi:glycosyltransferase involved in cell wall biosynthesis